MDDIFDDDDTFDSADDDAHVIMQWISRFIWYTILWDFAISRFIYYQSLENFSEALIEETGSRFIISVGNTFLHFIWTGFYLILSQSAPLHFQPHQCHPASPAALPRYIIYGYDSGQCHTAIRLLMYYIGHTSCRQSRHHYTLYLMSAGCRVLRRQLMDAFSLLELLNLLFLFIYFQFSGTHRSPDMA